MCCHFIILKMRKYIIQKWMGQNFCCCFDYIQKYYYSNEKRRTHSPLNVIIKHLGKTIPMQRSILIVLNTVEHWQQLQSSWYRISNIERFSFNNERIKLHGVATAIIFNIVECLETWNSVHGWHLIDSIAFLYVERATYQVSYIDDGSRWQVAGLCDNKIFSI